MESQQDSKVVLPADNLNLNNNSEAKLAPVPENRVVGKITEHIGRGEDAKHSIVWITIRWSFGISAFLTIVLFIFLGFAYYNNNQSEISELKKFILSVWSIFTPLITLSLGYAFGKDIKN